MAPSPDFVPRLRPDALELVEGGVVIELATCDAELLPECVMAFGARVASDGRLVTVYVPEAHAARTLANARANGQVAVVFARPGDHTAVQIKGTFQDCRSSDENDRAVQERYLAALTEQFALVGVPRALSRRLGFWPSLALEFRPREIFLQTPGPGAGGRLS